MNNPYLSIVFAARNDNYGGDFNQRLQNMLTWNIALLEEYAVPSEIILVNYNPLSENPPLSETMTWGKERKFVQVRIVTVPNEAHEQLVNPEVRKTVPLFEFPAKNVGVRRAKGVFILCTNADIFFDPAIIRHIGERRLQSGAFYRTDRYDFKALKNIDLSDKKGHLRAMKRNVFRYYVKGGEYSLRSPMPLSITAAGLHWFTKTRIFFESRLARRRADSLYHCHASGDFMLMHHSHWHALRGYPENTLISTHTDSMMVFKAATLPLQEKILPYAVYHQHHGRRYDFDAGMMNENMAMMYARMHNAAFTMLKNGKPLINNNNNWGLGGCKLEERVF